MTLDQRRRRLQLGIAICLIAIAAFFVAAMVGVNRHITLMSGMPLWPSLAILTGQWMSVRAGIIKYGPDCSETQTLAPRKITAAAIGVATLILAIGAFMLIRFAPPDLTSRHGSTPVGYHATGTE